MCDAADLGRLLPLAARAELVLVESQSASPQMGVSSAFSLGMAAGRLQGALEAFLGHGGRLVAPARWKASYGLQGGRAGKVDGLALARELLGPDACLEQARPGRRGADRLVGVAEHLRQNGIDCAGRAMGAGMCPMSQTDQPVSRCGRIAGLAGWAVIRTHPQAESLAIRAIEALGYRGYLPVCMVGREKPTRGAPVPALRVRADP